MKLLAIVLILLHGLIHLIGFAKAFSFAEVKQLQQPVSHATGLLWLLAGLLFLSTAILLLLHKPFWWIPGAIAIIFSQILIILYWQDAKFGTIANVLIAIAVLIGYKTGTYYQHYRNDLGTALKQSSTANGDILTEADLQGLPLAVQKYLRYTGCLGKTKVQHFKVVFGGQLRKNDSSPWMSFHSEQHNFLADPTRLFFMNAVMMKLPVAGYHRYQNQKAFMDIRLLSTFRVQYQDGPAMDEAETVTFFNDMCCMAPATLIDPRIQWQEIDSHTISARFTNKSITISATLHFNDEGQLINFISNDRFNADAGKKLPWSTPLKDYREINGYRIAHSAEAVYEYPEGPMAYGTFSLFGLKYNGEAED